MFLINFLLDFIRAYIKSEALFVYINYFKANILVLCTVIRVNLQPKPIFYFIKFKKYLVLNLLPLFQVNTTIIIQIIEEIIVAIE